MANPIVMRALHDLPHLCLKAGDPFVFDPGAESLLTAYHATAVDQAQVGAVLFALEAGELECDEPSRCAAALKAAAALSPSRAPSKRWRGLRVV